MVVSAASVWATLIAPVLTFAAAITAVVSVGWAESRRLRSQHRFEERRKLQGLIGEYRGRMLEAAVDWDRRMTQLYLSREEFEADPPENENVSQIERYLEDKGFENPDPVIRIYGKYSDLREYMFRSYVYRLVALCAIARKFESEAFYIDSHYAHPQDFEFLKFAKSFLWAVTSSDLPDDTFPGQDHIPNDDLRPILDCCYQPLSDDSESTSSDATLPGFDLPKLDTLIEHERQALQRRIGKAVRSQRARRATDPEAPSSVDREAQAPDGLGWDYIPQGFGKVLQLINGLRKPTSQSEPGCFPARLAWDRLCVLHLLAMAFIDEFGYPWQAHEREELERAVGNITDQRTIERFASALPKPLALLTPTTGRPYPWRRARKTGRAAVTVRQLLDTRMVSP